MFSQYSELPPLQVARLWLDVSRDVRSLAPMNVGYEEGRRAGIFV